MGQIEAKKSTAKDVITEAEDDKKDDEDMSTIKKNRAHVFSYALAAISVLALGFFGGWLGASSHDSSKVQTLVQQKTILKNEANIISEIAGTVGASVVSVNVTSQTYNQNPYSYFFGYGDGTQTQKSAGTGIIINEKGLILTNRHVVPEGTTSVSVTLSDGTVFDDVKVVGRTNNSDSLDIAFLQINDTKGQKLVPAKIGDSSLMKVGDTVVAIGNALGQFQNTVTSGIISGYGRSIQASDGSSSASVESLDDLFQTDAAINEGNSGGPLVNIAGEVIGINTAIASDSQSVGFAIPINNVAGLISSVQKTGKLERPYLGVRYVLLTDDIAKEYNLKVSRGAYIPYSSQYGSSVVADGPADKAGIKSGDVITKVDSTTISTKTSLASLLGKHSVGDTVKVTVVRGDETIELSVTLGAMPSE